MNLTAAVPAIDLQPQPSLLSWISDANLALLAPVVVYWAFSGLFHVIDTFELAELHRLHTPKEIETRNKCTMGEVVRAVLMQQAIQTALGYVVNQFESPRMVGDEDYSIWKIATNLNVSEHIGSFLYWWAFPGFRMLLAFLFIDTWQYILHRFMHTNQWAYRNFHSVHHRLYVPYAFGALYNSLLEGFLLDSVGTAIAGMLCGMSPRELIVLYSFSTFKTVDDHCGYEFPWDPLQIFFPNRATYHDIHHQQFGIKTNFSQPFFVHWDELFGSKYERTDEYIASQKELREKSYREKVAQAQKLKSD